MKIYEWILMHLCEYIYWQTRIDKILESFAFISPIGTLTHTSTKIVHHGESLLMNILTKWKQMFSRGGWHCYLCIIIITTSFLHIV